MTTDKQKNTVRYIERWTGIQFRGNIECYQSVSYFIGKYLSQAKQKNQLANMDYIFSGRQVTTNQ